MANPELAKGYRKHLFNWTPFIKASIPKIKNKCLLGDDALTVYFNNNATREALHINATFNTTWGVCSPREGWKYTWNIKAS